MRTVGGFILASLALAACQAPVSGPEDKAEPAVPAVAATAETPVQYFYFGNHVPRSVITAVEGADTASARLVGRTTPQDNYDYCVGYAGDDPDVVARCTPERVEQPEQVMTADCVARTVSDGSDAAWVRDEAAEGGKVMPVWQDRPTGQIRDYSGAGGGYVLTAAFRILCPAASANIASDPS